MSKGRVICVRITDDEHAQLNAHAKCQGVGISDLLRKMLDVVLK